MINIPNLTDRGIAAEKERREIPTWSNMKLPRKLQIELTFAE